MPLTLAPLGVECMVTRIGGSPEVKQHLETLGFAPGGCVTVLHSLGGNVIVRVMESRIAVSRELARNILVSERRTA